MPRHLAALLLLVAAAAASAADLVPTHASLAGFAGYTHDGMPFRLYIPAGYRAGTPYRLVLFLHGAGGRGSDNSAQISSGNSRLSRLWTGAAVQSATPCFVLAPQCPSGQQWVNYNWGNRTPYVLANVPQSAAMTKALAILALVRAQWTIDPDRIYVTGQSMGGYGTWDIACRHPDLFAAALPTAGGASPSAASRIAHLPVWSHHIANDGVVPPDTDRLMHAALVAAGGKPTYTEYATGGHNGWDQAAANPDTVRWMFAQVRGGPAGGSPSTYMSFSPDGGTLAAGATVTLASAQAGAAIRYSTDGSAVDPTTGTPYAGPLALAGAITLRAVASASGVQHHHAARFSAATAANPGTLGFVASTLGIDEGAGTATLSVARTGGSAGAVTVAWSAVGGTAVAGQDFAAGSGTLTWSAGDTTPRTIAIAVLDDALAEGTESFTVRLSGATGGATLGGATATVAIADDDQGAGPLPRLRWRCDEGAGMTVADSGAAGWDGALRNGAGWTASPFGTALLLANPTLAEQRHAGTGPQPVGNGSAVTVALWLRNDGGAGYEGGLASHLRRSGGTYFGGWELSLAKGKLAFVKGDPATGTFNSSLFSPVLPALSDGDWHHVAATWSAADGIARLWLDGVEVAQRSQPSARLGAVEADLRVGFTAINGREFHGAIDDVQVFDAALDAAAIGLLADGAAAAGNG